MSTPAERLLAAADLLDRRASEATEGPWQVDGPWWWEDEPGGPRATGMVTAGRARTAVAIAPKDTPEGNLRYVATMHPEVGRVSARLLRHAAQTWQDGADSDEPTGFLGFCLNLADLVLASGELP